MKKFDRKYGFNVSNLQSEDLIEKASSQGMTHIEINLSNSVVTLDEFDSKKIELLKSLSNKHNVSLSFHVPYHINISEILIPIRNSSLQYLYNCIDVAAKLNVTHITLHLGSFYWFPVEKWKRKRALHRFISSIREVIPVCEEKELTIALENVVPIPTGSEFHFLGDNINDFEYVFSEVKSSRLKFCLDTGHANMAEGVIKYLESFSEKLCSIHYHDNNGNNDEHLPVGEGRVPWDKFAFELQKISFEGPIISECRNIEADKSAQLFENYFAKI